MKKCGYCNHEVAHNAKSCPNCGGLWPVYGRSSSKLFVEKVHSIVQVRGKFSPSFESHPKPYSELFLEIGLGLLAFSFAGIFFLSGLALLRGLVAKWTGNVEILADVNSISSFLGLGLQTAIWVALFLTAIFSIALLIAHGMAYYRKKFNRNC